MIEGKLVYNNWEDKDGLKHLQVEIVINELLSLEKASE